MCCSATFCIWTPISSLDMFVFFIMGENLIKNALNLPGCGYRELENRTILYFLHLLKFFQTIVDVSVVHITNFLKNKQFFILSHSHSLMDTTQNPYTIRDCLFSCVASLIWLKGVFLVGCVSRRLPSALRFILHTSQPCQRHPSNSYIVFVSSKTAYFKIVF